MSINQLCTHATCIPRRCKSSCVSSLGKFVGVCMKRGGHVDKLPCMPMFVSFCSYSRGSSYFCMFCYLIFPFAVCLLCLSHTRITSCNSRTQHILRLHHTYSAHTLSHAPPPAVLTISDPLCLAFCSPCMLQCCISQPCVPSIFPSPTSSMFSASMACCLPQ